MGPALGKSSRVSLYISGATYETAALRQLLLRRTLIVGCFLLGNSSRLSSFPRYFFVDIRVIFAELAHSEAIAPLPQRFTCLSE